MLSQLVLIRAFEEYVLELAGEGLIHGPAHSSIGQEGGAVGSVLAADERGLGQRLPPRPPPVPRQGARPRRTQGHRPARRRLPDDVRAVLLRTLAEICGLDRGFCHGRGGSMHLQWHEAGAIGTNAIVGGGVPLAAGFAWAHRHAGTDAVAVTYFGDGAVNIGSTLETFNLAAAWKLPICFFIENNQLRRVDDASRRPPASRGCRRAGRASASPAGGSTAWTRSPCTWRCSEALAAHARRRRPDGRRGRRLPLLPPERRRSPAAPSATAPRRRSSRGASATRSTSCRAPPRAARHPRPRTRSTATVARPRPLMAEIGDVLLEPRARRQAGPAADQAGASGPTRLRRRRRRAATCREFDDAAVRRPRHVRAASSRSRKFIDAVAARDGPADGDRRPRSSSWARTSTGSTAAPTAPPGASRTSFPDRVLGTPISENAFTGLGGGIALDGRYRPVVEFMYADFMWVAADQLFNQIGKARHMFGGDGAVPFVLRSKVAMGTGYGSQHSMDPAGIFATAPGWRIVAPSTPFDYVGLMNTALRCNDPVVVLEHVDLYDSARATRPVDDLDYLPARRQGGACGASGSDVTVLTYLAMVELRASRRSSSRRRRRRGDRPALARPGQHRLGHHRRQHPQDQPRADRRAGRASARRTAAGWPTRSSAATSTGSTSRSSASPAARRRRASARCSSAPPSPRPKRSPPSSPKIVGA